MSNITHAAVQTQEVRNNVANGAPLAPQTEPAMDLEQELTAGFAHKFIRFKAKQLIGQAGLKSADREDIEQDLRLLVLSRAAQFDPTKSDWPAFITTIVERRIASILQYHKRQKRCGGIDPLSLSEPVCDSDGGPAELGDLVSLDDVSRHTRAYPRSEQEWVELEHDLPLIIERLPPDFQHVCRRLLERTPLSTIAAELGIPRTSVIYLLEQIAPLLADQGISEIS